MDAVFDWVTTYGPGALFLLLLLGIVGLPVPDETLLVFTGYLISKGRLHAPTTWIAAVLGSWCGITASYWIGRTAGLGVVHRFGKYIHVDEQKLERVHAWLGRRGHWALFIGYYIAGVRHLTALIAGTSKLEFRTFVLYAWSGGLIWVSGFLTLGYYVGEDWRRIFELVHKDLLLVSLIAAAVLLAYFLWRRAVNNNNPKPK